jgi:hypothetical protein
MRHNHPVNPSTVFGVRIVKKHARAVGRNHSKRQRLQPNPVALLFPKLKCGEGGPRPYRPGQERG